MTSIRRQFGRWVTRMAGGFSQAAPTLAAGGDALQTANIAWAVILIVVILISAFIILKAAVFWAEILLAVLWGLFIGFTMLFFFHPKLLITIVGGLISVMVSDLAGMGGVIEKTAKAIKDIVEALNKALEGTVTLHPISAWLFLLLILVCCLPAYREHQ